VTNRTKPIRFFDPRPGPPGPEFLALAAYRLQPLQAVKVAVIMNSGAGGIGTPQCEAQVARVKAALANAQVEAEVVLCAGKDLAQAARNAAASGVDAVVAAGGDGTVSSIAGALAGGDVPVAVLPLGTLNHFARDIGMPADLDEAAKVIAANNVERIDIGEVNGRFFINNSSIGLYPEIVVTRDAERRRGISKWWAMLIAARRVLSRFPLMRVRVLTQASLLVTPTPFLFVGNNDYAVNALTLGQRTRLDRGQLSLYMMHCTGRLKMFWLMVRALLQRLDAVADFETRAVTELRVDLSRRRLRVALDGEVTQMRSPLFFQIWPLALRVLRAPQLDPGTSP
jgi:diacylglycerol kinase family enzyme